jgi:hypothetical protein
MRAISSASASARRTSWTVCVQTEPRGGTDLGRQGVDVGVRVCAHLGQHGDPWTGDTQGDFLQLFFRGHAFAEPLKRESVKKSGKIPRLSAVAGWL